MLQQLSDFLHTQANVFSQTGFLNALVTSVSERILTQRIAQAYYCGFICLYTEQCDFSGEHTVLLSAYPTCSAPYTPVPQGFCC